MAKDLVRLLGPVMTTGQPSAYTGPLKTSQRSWDMVLERWGVPLIDSEVNLMQQINRERIEDFITSMALPGWLKASNFGAANAVDLQYDETGPYIHLSEDSWLVGNGKMIHVSNPDFNDTGGLRMSLPALPSIGVTRHDLVFLEVWRHEIAPAGEDTAADPTTPDVTENPSSSQGQTRTLVFKNGGVDNGNWTNDLITDASTGVGGGSGPFGETTRRIQLRWRVRTVTGIDFTANKFGLGTSNGSPNTAIKPQGGKMSDAAGIAGYTFKEVPPQEGLGDLYTNLSEAFGKGRLWRSCLSDGTDYDAAVGAAALNTVDGYVYAVPMFHLTMSGNGLDSAVDMRQLSHVFLPDHSIHADTLTTFDDPSQPGVYGAAFETVVDPNLGRNVKSNIRRKSITGGTNGDIALNTITSDNIVDNSINGTFITNNSITINKLNIDSIGLPTVFVQNRSGLTRTNGDVVILERDSLATWDGFYVANAAGHLDGNTQQLGVVANYRVDGTEDTIVNNAYGYVRLLGQVAKLNVSAAVVAGQALCASTTTPGTATNGGAGSVNDVFAFAVTSGNSQVRALLVPRLADGTIRTSKLYDGSVTTAKIGDNQVTTTKIAPGNVLNTHIGDAQIDTRTLANQAVTAAKIQLASITTAQIADRNILSQSIAVGNITATELGSNAVTNAKIADNAVTAVKIADGNVITSKIANANILAQHIADNAIVSAAIGAGQILSTHIGAGQVVHDAIAAKNIDSALIADQGISTANLSASCVTPSRIVNGAITNAKIGVPFIFSVAVNLDPPGTFPLVSGGSPQDVVWQQVDYLNTAVACGFSASSIWNPSGDHSLINIPQDGYYLVRVEVTIQPPAVAWWGDVEIAATIRAAAPGTTALAPYILANKRLLFPATPGALSGIGFVTLDAMIDTIFNAGDQFKIRIRNTSADGSLMTGLTGRLVLHRLGSSTLVSS